MSKSAARIQGILLLILTYAIVSRILSVFHFEDLVASSYGTNPILVIVESSILALLCSVIAACTVGFYLRKRNYFSAQPTADTLWILLPYVIFQSLFAFAMAEWVAEIDQVFSLAATGEPGTFQILTPTFLATLVIPIAISALAAFISLRMFLRKTRV